MIIFDAGEKNLEGWQGSGATPQGGLFYFYKTPPQIAATFQTQPFEND